MLKNFSTLAFMPVLFLVLAAGAPLNAHTTGKVMDVEWLSLPEQGRQNDYKAVIRLKNVLTEQNVHVWLVPVPSPKHTMRFDGKFPASISNGGSADISLKIQFKDGKHLARFLIKVYADPNKTVLVGVQGVALSFLARAGTAYQMPYEKVFLPSLPKEMAEGYSSVSVPAKGPFSNEYKESKPRIGELKVTPGSLPPPGQSQISAKSKKVKPQPGKTPVTPPSTPQPTQPTQPTTPDGGILNFTYEPRLDYGNEPQAFFAANGTKYHISGKFSYIGLDTLWHPAWNWSVWLWWNDNGNWKMMAATWIHSDGSWEFDLEYPGYAGQHLRVQYRTENNYIYGLNKDDETHKWKGPDRNNIGVNFDEGHWGADCSNGEVAGLGEVWKYAHDFWWKLKSNGFEPIREEPIKLYFPNTDYACGNADGKPWSCASQEGTVWLIPAHADPHVVQHELTHQLQNEYWDNYSVPNSTGQHFLSKCWVKGGAMTEGFANMVPYWVMKSVDDADPELDYAGKIETRSTDPAKHCQDGDINEMWVAANFWDLMDRHDDGLDDIYFINPANVLSIYLNKDNLKNDMFSRLKHYQDAATDGHEQFITDIFTENKIDGN